MNGLGANISEVDDIENMMAGYPPLHEVIQMCCDLRLEIDNLRTIEEADAWAYYHELKAMIDQQQRKTA